MPAAAEVHGRPLFALLFFVIQVWQPPAHPKVLARALKDFTRPAGQSVFSAPYGNFVFLAPGTPFTYIKYGQKASPKDGYYLGGRVEKCTDDEHLALNPKCEHIEDVVCEKNLQDALRCVLARQAVSPSNKPRVELPRDSPLRGQTRGWQIRLVDGMWQRV